MQVLSWYTALGPAVGSRCFSTLPLSPVRTDCRGSLKQLAAVRHAGKIGRLMVEAKSPGICAFQSQEPAQPSNS